MPNTRKMPVNSLPSSVESGPFRKRYPVVGSGVVLTREMLADVAHVLSGAGWPTIRHEDDYRRLVVALRWYARGTGDEPSELS